MMDPLEVAGFFRLLAPIEVCKYNWDYYDYDKKKKEIIMIII